MNWLYALIALVVIVLLGPLWVALLTNGKRRRLGGGFGPALGELNAMFDPSQRRVAEVRDERVVERAKDEPLP